MFWLYGKGEVLLKYLLTLGIVALITLLLRLYFTDRKAKQLLEKVENEVKNA